VSLRSNEPLTRLERVQTNQSTDESSPARPANATVEARNVDVTTTQTLNSVGVDDGTTTPTLDARCVDDGWEPSALERDRRALAAYAAAPPVFTHPRKAQLEAIARATEQAHAETSAGVDVACNSPPSTRATPAAAEPSPPIERRSREHRLKSALAALQLEKRIARRAAAKAATRVALPDDAVWGPKREKRIIEARAKVRQLMERVPKARERYADLTKDPTTAHFAIALKKLCDEHEWTLADNVARRLLTLIEFFREFARPQCWNAHRARAPLPRGLGRTGAVLERSKRKFSPCVTAVAQPFLAGVIADAGDGPNDDRSVCRKTVGRLTQLLVDVGVLQCVQVPAAAAESYEVGTSGHAIYRYWLADKGSPKPALMGPWTADGALVDVAILDEPWRGAVVVRPPATAPP
jgi:hypothetical protein